MKNTYEIEVDCAVCAQKCEDAIKKLDGVLDCRVNFLTQKMTLETDDGANQSALMKTILKTVRKIEPDFEIEGF